MSQSSIAARWLVTVCCCSLMVIFVTSTIRSDDQVCCLYLAPSTVPAAGRGVFAGRDYEKHEILTHDIPLLIPYKYVYRTMLSHYVYSLEEEQDQSMILLGISSFFNRWVDSFTIILSHQNIPQIFLYVFLYTRIDPLPILPLFFNHWKMCLFLL